MGNVVNLLSGWIVASYFSAKTTLTSEVKRIKDDERGLELLQVLIIVAIVIIIAAALIAMLWPLIQDLLGIVDEETTTLIDIFRRN